MLPRSFNLHTKHFKSPEACCLFSLFSLFDAIYFWWFHRGQNCSKKKHYNDRFSNYVKVKKSLSFPSLLIHLNALSNYFMAWITGNLRRFFLALKLQTFKNTFNTSGHNWRSAGRKARYFSYYWNGKNLISFWIPVFWFISEMTYYKVVSRTATSQDRYISLCYQV